MLFLFKSLAIIITATTQHFQFNTHTEYTEIKNLYMQVTASIRSIKAQYKKAQQEQNQTVINQLQWELNKAKSMYIHYMLIMKSDAKLIKSFKLNSALLKNELTVLQFRIKRAYLQSQALHTFTHLQETNIYYSFSLALSQANSTEFLLEKINRILTALQ